MRPRAVHRPARPLTRHTPPSPCRSPPPKVRRASLIAEEDLSISLKRASEMSSRRSTSSGSASVNSPGEYDGGRRDEPRYQKPTLSSATRLARRHSVPATQSSMGPDKGGAVGTMLLVPPRPSPLRLPGDGAQRSPEPRGDVEMARHHSLPSRPADAASLQGAVSPKMGSGALDDKEASMGPSPGVKPTAAPCAAPEITSPTARRASRPGAAAPAAAPPVAKATSTATGERRTPRKPRSVRSREGSEPLALPLPGAAPRAATNSSGVPRSQPLPAPRVSTQRGVLHQPPAAPTRSTTEEGHSPSEAGRGRLPSREGAPPTGLVAEARAAFEARAARMC